jgi:hypothetical protein
MRKGFLLVLAAATATLWTAGCFNSSPQVNVNASGWQERLDNKLDKTQAISTAKAKARDEGVNPKDYAIAAEKVRDDWFVYFDTIVRSNEAGWPAHFSVKVTPDGKAKLLKPAK